MELNEYTLILTLKVLESPVDPILLKNLSKFQS